MADALQRIAMDTTAAHRTSGPELLAEREEADFTQAQVAEVMGVDRSTLSRAEQFVRVKPAFARRYREALAALTQKRDEAA